MSEYVRSIARSAPLKRLADLTGSLQNGPVNYFARRAPLSTIQNGAQSGADKGWTPRFLLELHQLADRPNFATLRWAGWPDRPQPDSNSTNLWDTTFLSVLQLEMSGFARFFKSIHFLYRTDGLLMRRCRFWKSNDPCHFAVVFANEAVCASVDEMGV